MNKVNTSPPSGTRDFLSADLKFREKILNKTKKIFESFGFLPIDTPAFERIEILMGKYGYEGEKLIFKILKRGKKSSTGESDFALRYDFTVPLARIVAKYGDQLPSIFKRYQIGPVWRADRPGKNRFREFYQADIDIVGIDSLVADIEIILVISEALTALGLKEFTINLNSRKILIGLMETLDIPKSNYVKILTILDKFDKINIEGIRKELSKSDISQKSVKNILDLFKRLDSGTEMFSVFQKLLRSSSIGMVGMKEVEEIIDIASPLLKEGKIVFSPFLARGLAYYDGPIFEIFCEGVTTSIASGGRYNKLIGAFGKKDIPACGGSLGIERIISLLNKKALGERESLSVDALITVWDRGFLRDSLSLASGLRNLNLSVEVYLGEKDKISKQLRYASNKKIPFVVIFGPDEKDKGEVSVKDMKTGKQKNIPLNKIADYFKRTR